MAAELDTVDEEAVAYGGTAHAEGIEVLRLQHCVGPMVQLDEFDDPESVRTRKPPGGRNSTTRPAVLAFSLHSMA